MTMTCSKCDCRLAKYLISKIFRGKSGLASIFPQNSVAFHNVTTEFAENPSPHPNSSGLKLQSYKVECEESNKVCSSQLRFLFFF
jgi:hypothetical protein